MNTVESLNNGHFVTNINSSAWFVPCIEVVLFMRFQSHYIDRGDKIWGFSFVHCGGEFNTVSLSRSVRKERFYYIGCFLVVNCYSLRK